jgi:adenosylmethionine-8-amino-7-oxononanoate aminotransferase
VPVAEMQRRFVDAGAWIRPFANLVYLMPPYVISPEEVQLVFDVMTSAIGAATCD